MGQYYKIVNLDKRQFLYPPAFGDGLKLLEFCSGSSGTLTALGLLLANSNGRGGGDLRTSRYHEVIGSWAGDRIVVAGDYADEGDPGEKLDCSQPEGVIEAMQDHEYENLYGRCCARSYCDDLSHDNTVHFTDISHIIMAAMMDDSWMKDKILSRMKEWATDTQKTYLKLAAQLRGELLDV